MAGDGFKKRYAFLIKFSFQRDVFLKNNKMDCVRFLSVLQENDAWGSGSRGNGNGGAGADAADSQGGLGKGCVESAGDDDGKTSADAATDGGIDHKDDDAAAAVAAVEAMGAVEALEVVKTVEAVEDFESVAALKAAAAGAAL